jgi:hypothetical protein
MGRNSAPGEQEEAGLGAESSIADGVVAKVNAFFEKDWAEFRKLVESTPIKKFKDIEVIK